MDFREILKRMRCKHTSRGPVFSYKLRYIVGFWLVEMAISTNQKPTIYRNLYENTAPVLHLYIYMHASVNMATFYGWKKRICYIDEWFTASTNYYLEVKR